MAEESLAKDVLKDRLPCMRKILGQSWIKINDLVTIAYKNDSFG
jgi:hypothetical protein